VRLKGFVMHLTKHPSLVILEVTRTVAARSGELARAVDIYGALIRRLGPRVQAHVPAGQRVVRPMAGAEPQEATPSRRVFTRYY